MPEASRVIYSTESAAKKMGIHKRTMLRLAAKIGKPMRHATFNIFTEDEIKRMENEHAKTRKK